MKKIIDGKAYNTETADCIADEGKSLHDFFKSSEAIYRTKKGAWFLFGESSAGGKYGSSDGNNQSSGEDIIALTPAEVAKWAEDANITDEERTDIATVLNLPEA